MPWNEVNLLYVFLLVYRIIPGSKKAETFSSVIEVTGGGVNHRLILGDFNSDFSSSDFFTFRVT